MKKLSALILSIIFLGLTGPSIAQEAWLLLYKNNHYIVAKLTDGRFQHIADLGQRPTYGESESTFGFLSRKSASESYILDLVEKTSGQVIQSVPVSGEVLAQLSGPSKDLVVTDKAVYFITVRFLGLPGVEPNEKGGSFDLNRLDISSGAVRTIALPKEIANPRLVDYKGEPVVYSWNGYRVWRFDTSKGNLRELTSTDNLVEILLEEKEGSSDGRVTQGSFSDYAFVPTMGAFRLSKMGKIHRVLNGNLAPLENPDRSINLDDARDVKIFPAVFDNEAALGVLQKRAGGWSFSYFDPVSFKIQDKIKLTKDVLPNTVFPATGNAVFYVDQAMRSINRASKNDTAVIWKLDEEGVRSLNEVRIIQANTK